MVTARPVGPDSAARGECGGARGVRVCPAPGGCHVSRVTCHVSRVVLIVTCHVAAPGHGPQHQGPGARRHASGGGAGAGARPRGQVGVTWHV